jgi:selenide,water dikinase
MAIAVATVPILDGAIDLVDGNTPGGGRTNAQHFGAGAHADAGLDPRLVQLLYDPQTSGGLLAAVDPDAVAEALGALTERGVPAQVVGTVETAGKVAVHLY